MTRKTQNLEELRQQIDGIDESIHDLIMQRSELVERIRAAKDGDGPFIRPGREAQVLRRILDRHHGLFPRAVLARIWREIIGAFLGMQGPFAVAAYATEDGPNLFGLARDHFGSMTQVTTFSSQRGVLRAVNEKKATVGVLPLPESDRGDPWWPHLERSSGRAPRIVARLPFVPLDSGPAPGPDGLVVALSPFEASGRDRSYLIVETLEPLSRGAFTGLLTGADFQVAAVQVWEDGRDRRLHLVEVDGYVGEDDVRLAALEAGQGRVNRLWAIGGYARPLSKQELLSPAAT